eukprot:6810887-Pyramimonas_sp.AAC.1
MAGTMVGIGRIVEGLMVKQGKGGGEDGGGTMGQRYSGDSGGDSVDSGRKNGTTQWDSGGVSGTMEIGSGW